MDRVLYLLSRGRGSLPSLGSSSFKIKFTIFTTTLLCLKGIAEQVINNQYISDATSRFMELYRALQAMIHFNQRNNEIVSNLKEYINNTCLNLQVSQADVSPSENALSYVLNQHQTKTRIDLPDGFNNSVCRNNNEQYSIVGPMASSDEIGMIADIADSHGTLQVTPYSFSEKTFPDSVDQQPMRKS